MDTQLQLLITWSTLSLFLYPGWKAWEPALSQVSWDDRRDWVNGSRSRENPWALRIFGEGGSSPWLLLYVLKSSCWVVNESREEERGRKEREHETDWEKQRAARPWAGVSRASCTEAPAASTASASWHRFRSRSDAECWEQLRAHCPGRVFISSSNEKNTCIKGKLAAFRKKWIHYLL